jgi:archaemetzincin
MDRRPNGFDISWMRSSLAPAAAVRVPGAQTITDLPGRANTRPGVATEGMARDARTMEVTDRELLLVASVALFLGALVLLVRRLLRVRDARRLVAPLAGAAGGELVVGPRGARPQLAALILAGVLVGACLARVEAESRDPHLAPGTALHVERQISTTLTSFASRPALTYAELSRLVEHLSPLAQKMGPIQPGDWLAYHREPGQTFLQYLDGAPVLPDSRRQAIYLQPIGEFATPGQQRLIDLTAEFLSRTFCLPVKIAAKLPASIVPPYARRSFPRDGDTQLLTGYLLDRLLKPRLPRDAVAYLALTEDDLWPGAGWNFVFGQASYSDRIGVWSIFRNGDPDGEPAEARLCLRRTLMTATHETGHMFSIKHCTRYECNMCGSNSRTEADRRPLALCPECLAKVLFAARCDARDRYRSLAGFCERNGLTEEAARYRQLLGALDQEGIAEPRPTSRTRRRRPSSVRRTSRCRARRARRPSARR